MVSLNKITQDRYLPTGPEMAHAAQLYDISGEKVKCYLISQQWVSLTMQTPYRPKS